MRSRGHEHGIEVDTRGVKDRTDRFNSHATLRGACCRYQIGSATRQLAVGQTGLTHISF